MANPVVTFEMANGKKIKAELYPEIAPNTEHPVLHKTIRQIADEME